MRQSNTKTKFFMKTKFLMLAILLSALVAKSQINQVGMISNYNNYNGSDWVTSTVGEFNLVHLTTGYKFFSIRDTSYSQSGLTSNRKYLNIHGLNGNVEKSQLLPSLTWQGWNNNKPIELHDCYLVSDHLFDNDDELEFLAIYSKSENMYMGSRDTSVLYLMDENGAIIQTLAKSSYRSLFPNYFSDGSTFSKLLTRNEEGLLIYDLPGYLPCESCSNNTTGSTKSLAPMAPSGMRVNVAPNPSAGEFTFHYQLPKGKNNAELTITNLNGVIVKTKKINNEIGSTPLLLNDLSSGIYIYTIQCEAERSTPQRIILTK